MIETVAERPSNWKEHPDTTISVETTRVDESGGGVPTVIIEEPRPDSGRAADRGPDQDDCGADRSRQQEPPQPPQPQPSMIRNLLITGAVALSCGVIGAMGYSYLFDSKSGESSSQKRAGSQEEAKSEGKAKAGGGGGAQKESGRESSVSASASSSIPGFSSAEDAATLKRQIMDLMLRVDRLGERVDRMTRPRDETPPVLRTMQIKMGELAREMDEVAQLPARFRHLENRLETLQEDLKTLRARIEAQHEGASAGGPPGLTPSRGPGAPAAPEGSDQEELPTMELGISLLERGQYASAREVFQRLQLTRPKDARVWYFSALAEGLTSGDWDGEAQKLAEKGLERERAGTPPTAQIDAALATRPPIRGQDWIAALRRRVLSAPKP